MGNSNYQECLRKATAEAIRVRRHIHQYPELSGEESQTSVFLQKELRERNWEIYPIAASTSFLAYKAGQKTRTVGFRAELDALPINDTSIEFPSMYDGVMHACGHDMHMGLGIGLSFLRDSIGDALAWPNLLLVFESSEEVLPGGAQSILASEVFQTHKPDRMFAFHCEPDLPVGTIGICPGSYMASGDEIRISVYGKAAHGALPHTGVDTLLVAAHVLIALQSVASRNAPPNDPMVLSFGNIECNGRMNLIPASVRLDGTLRTHSETWRVTAKQRIVAIAELTAASFGACAEVAITPGYPTLYNEPELAHQLPTLFKDIEGLELVTLSQRMTTDDFAYFAQTIPSLFLRLGVGPTGNLHSAQFCPSEAAFPYALEALTRLVTCD